MFGQDTVLFYAQDEVPCHAQSARVLDGQASGWLTWAWYPTRFVTGDERARSRNVQIPLNGYRLYKRSEARSYSPAHRARDHAATKTSIIRSASFAVFCRATDLTSANRIHPQLIPGASMTENNVLHAKLESARRELLDLTTRNRLLSTSRSATRSGRLEIVDELSEEVFRIWCATRRP